MAGWNMCAAPRRRKPCQRRRRESRVPSFAPKRTKVMSTHPRLAHAAAAAVLRSGYLSQEQNHAPGEKPFAVDLSSERVHRAKWLLDGVRQGQSLSALLGYRFERGLHEQGLDRYIHRFRTLTSLKENKRFADIHEKLGRAERTAREVAALYAQRDQATGRAADARALRPNGKAARKPIASNSTPLRWSHSRHRPRTRRWRKPRKR